MVKFTLTIKTTAGMEWELPFSSVSFSEELNKDRVANFTIVRQTGEQVAALTGTTLEAILSGGYREVEIRDSLGVLVYSGFIDETTGNAGASEYGNVSVTSRGFLALLEKRYTANLVTYTATDAGAIAWDLISDTQAKTYGNFGITMGSIIASKNRDRTYKWRNIKEAILALTSDNVKDGFDFDIDTGKVFNVYPQKGSSRPEIIFDSKFNIDRWTVRKTGILGMANHVIVFGAGNEDDMIVEERTSAPGYKAAYFLLEEGLSDKDNGNATLLQDKGDAYLASYQYPKKFVNISVFYDNPTYSTYNVGDYVRVKIAEEGVDAMMRILRRSCSMDGTVDLVLKSI